MKLLKLEIQNIRGIREASFEPRGENLTICGPNGSGKSAVVDALDLLLTGEISRLTGEGTKGITTKRYGPHIDHRPRDGVVKALVSVTGVGEPIEISRSLADPKKLLFDQEHSAAIGPILIAAAKGQHVLSRRQILRFITAEGGKRAEQVQELLDLSSVETKRKALKTAETAARNSHTAAKAERESAQKELVELLALSTYSDKLTLRQINLFRKTLGAAPLTSLDSLTLKQGVEYTPVSQKEAATNRTEVRLHLAKMQEFFGAGKDEAKSQLHTIAECARFFAKQPSAIADLKRISFLRSGEELIPKSGHCPFCDKEWAPGTLAGHIAVHLERLEGLRSNAEDWVNALEKVERFGSTGESLANFFREIAEQLQLAEEATAFRDWNDAIGKTLKELKERARFVRGEHPSARLLSTLLWPATLPKVAQKVVSLAETQAPLKSPEQEAWDLLTKAEERVRDLEAREERFKVADRLYQFMKGVPIQFEQARDETLLNLYTSIDKRLTELYRAIHHEDESTFESSLKPAGAALTLEVDFYGRGSHPPHALHSEGHQDTMGLCLYLALSEKLIGSTIGMTILDDVVMSVDADHRRHLCEMLKEFFTDRQFVITTHDRLWSRQLQTTAMAKRRNTVRFSGWSVETGPVLEVDSDLWQAIEDDLDKDDVPAAAHRLRRNAEAFFEESCEQLQGKVNFRADGKFSLGDLGPAAVSAYKKLLKRAILAARFWKDKEQQEALKELESVAGQVINRSQVEQWAINESVHFNRWSQMRKNDFRPVSLAWRDLLELFRCSSCQGTIRVVSTKSMVQEMVKCPCSAVRWNLKSKPSK